MNVEEFENRVKQVREFFPYLHILKEALPQYLIIIAVGGTGSGEYFSQECALALMDLGLQVNMFGRSHQPYIAMVQNREIIFEKCSDELDKALIINGEIIIDSPLHHEKMI